MYKLFQTLFHRKTILFSGAIAALLFAVTLGFDTFYYEVNDFFVFNFLSAILIVGLLGAYRAGEINCQKALTGGLLFVFFADTMQSAMHAVLAHTENVIYILRWAAIVIVLAVVIACYFLLQSDHVGERLPLTVSQIALVILFLLFLSNLIAEIILGTSRASNYCYSVAMLAFVHFIIAIQTNVQNYKKIRADAIAAGTWDAAARAEAKKLFRF